MPEGPETHYVADRLNDALAGDPLLRVEFSLPALKPYEKRLTGRRIEGVEARGKALLTRFEKGLTLYTHSQLLGYWDIVKTSSRSEPAGTPRVLLVAKRNTAALHIAPKVEIWKTADIESHPFLMKLGPDVLDSSIAVADFVAQLNDPRFRRRPLAALLLDQSFAAGMGNYLRSEALYAARLAPSRKSPDLDDDETLKLAHALIAVPRRAYRAKFKGALPAAGKDYLAQTRKTFRFHVFEREGEPCSECGGEIVMQRIAGRRLYWCPHCQH